MKKIILLILLMATKHIAYGQNLQCNTNCYRVDGVLYKFSIEYVEEQKVAGNTIWVLPQQMGHHKYKHAFSAWNHSSNETIVLTTQGQRHYLDVASPNEILYLGYENNQQFRFYHA